MLSLPQQVGCSPAVGTQGWHQLAMGTGGAPLGAQGHAGCQHHVQGPPSLHEAWGTADVQSTFPLGMPHLPAPCHERGNGCGVCSAAGRFLLVQTFCMQTPGCPHLPREGHCCRDLGRGAPKLCLPLCTQHHPVGPYSAFQPQRPPADPQPHGNAR